MNLPRSLPTDPHSPHACSTPRVYTFSITWTVLWLLIFLTLGYRNRPDRKSSGSVAATGFLPGVLSFLCALSHLERIVHRPTTCSTNLNHPSDLERALHHWRGRPHTVQHCVVTTTHWEKQTRAFQQVQQWQVTSYFPIHQHRIDSRSGCRGCVTNNPRRGKCRFELFRQRMYRLSRNKHRYMPFRFRGCTRVSL
jgi:hypothetical protein